MNAADTPRPSVRAVVGTLLAVGVAQSADAVTFIRMVRDHGTGVEANPFVAWVATDGDPWLLLPLKVALIALVVAVFAITAPRHPILSSVVATAAVLAGLIGTWSNIVVIVAGTAGRGAA